jgi:hypothetical protein
MNRTVTALYETKAQAERVRDALVAAHLGDHVEIRDQDGETRGHRDIVEWLGDLFGGHADRETYGEGLRRGHFLLTAKVEDFNEIRAAELLDADAPVDLDHAEKAWRAEGWAPSPAATPAAADPAPDAASAGVRIRVYTLHS